MTKCMVIIILSVESSYNKYIEDVVSDNISSYYGDEYNALA